MKTTLFFSTILVTLFTVNISNAQCIAPASNFGNNTVSSYEVTGDVTLTLNANDTFTLDLGANFGTAAGPDVRAYIVKSNGLSDATLQTTKISGLENLEFGITASSGAQTFNIPIPNGTVIEGFDRVFFYCLQFNAFWDFSPFTSFTGSNCNLLGLENNSLNKITVYPNPAREIIHLKGLTTGNETEIRIFDILGKIAYSQNKTDRDINVSQLNAGIYLLSISNQGRRTTQKLVIQ